MPPPDAPIRVQGPGRAALHESRGAANSADPRAARGGRKGLADPCDHVRASLAGRYAATVASSDAGSRGNLDSSSARKSKSYVSMLSCAPVWLLQLVPRSHTGGNRASS